MCIALRLNSVPILEALLVVQFTLDENLATALFSQEFYLGRSIGMLRIVGGSGAARVGTPLGHLTNSQIYVKSILPTHFVKLRKIENRSVA